MNKKLCLFKVCFTSLVTYALNIGHAHTLETTYHHIHSYSSHELYWKERHSQKKVYKDGCRELLWSFFPSLLLSSYMCLKPCVVAKKKCKVFSNNKFSHVRRRKKYQRNYKYKQS